MTNILEALVSIFWGVVIYIYIVRQAGCGLLCAHVACVYQGSKFYSWGLGALGLTY